MCICIHVHTCIYVYMYIHVRECIYVIGEICILLYYFFPFFFLLKHGVEQVDEIDTHVQPRDGY